jgi:hypothetical protein
MVQNIGTHLPWIVVSSVRLGLAEGLLLLVSVALMTCCQETKITVHLIMHYRPSVVTRQHYGDTSLKQQRYGI